MKNSIWYRFSSEKESYQITFDTIDISIRDIKQKIIRRRNMIKFPEEFELIFYDEENPEIEIEDKDLIKPMKHLIVKRLPRYSRKSSFIKIIREPKDFYINKMNENIIRKDELQQIKRYKEPLEKISKYLRKEIIYKQFKCKICENLNEDSYNNFIISLCCKETYCLNCYNKDDEKCPFCKEPKKGYVKNEAENNLIKKLFDILEKKEEMEKMQKAQELVQNNTKNNNLNSVNNINQKSIENNNNNNNNSSNNNISNNQGINKVIDPSTSYQLQKQLMEGSQFIIIKSSNVENIEKSKNHLVWATTISNTNRLNQAFSKGKVILIFSVNGAQLFKGYAIMTSFSSEQPSNLWQLENNIKLGGDFSVSWLCYCELPFIKTKHLQVNKSRDCTELDINIGYKLCELCYEQEKEELERNPKRIKVEINEQIINKINEDINNNKNKQKQKMNNNNINNKQQQINNEVNKVGLINNNNINIESNPNQIQNIQPIYPPQFRPVIYLPYINYQNQFPQMQQKQQEINNPNIMMPMMVNQTQTQTQQKKENEKKENIKEEHKKKSRHTKRRSRSRDKSRNKNKSRSSRSRRSNSSNSSRDERKSKYSKSYK